MSDNTKMFTEDEKIIAKHIDRKCKWIARDSDGCIYIFIKKPTKLENGWNSSTGFDEFFAFNHMFKSIKWEDDEPTRISDIYNPQILNEAEREYLKTVLKPFHEEVKYVRKFADNPKGDGTYGKEFLFIAFHDGNFAFSDFDSGKMYSGMEPNKKYTLEELEL